MPQQLDLSAEQDPLALRRDAYPTNGDQNGAFAKFMKVVLPYLPPEALAEMPPEVTAIIAAIDEVKAAIPKPEGTQP